MRLVHSMPLDSYLYCTFDQANLNEGSFYFVLLYSPGKARANMMAIANFTG